MLIKEVSRLKVVSVALLYIRTLLKPMGFI